ncbi:MAG: AgmX/PglI C-terminal domain-containing protein [Polyangiaceae bacterium]
MRAGVEGPEAPGGDAAPARERGGSRSGDGQLPAPISGKLAVCAFVALTAAFLGVVLWGMGRVRNRLPDAPLAAAPLGSAGGVAVADLPPRGPCSALGAVAASAPACSDDLVAWCDTAGTRVACCKEGMTAGVQAGECACPLGGPLEPSAKAAGCPEPTVRAAHAVSIRGVFEGARPRLRACYQRALAATADERGSLAIDLSLGASGAPFTVAIARSTLADEAGDSCAVGVVRGLRFAPPYNGFLALTYPIDL